MTITFWFTKGKDTRNSRLLQSLHQYLHIFALLHKPSSGYSLYFLLVSLFNKLPPFIAYKHQTRNLICYIYIFHFIIPWTLIKLICISEFTNGGHLSGLVHITKLNLRQSTLRANLSLSRKPSPTTILQLSFRGLSLLKEIGPASKAFPVFVLPLLTLYNTHSYSSHQWIAFPQIKNIKLITKLSSFCHLTTQMRWLLFHLFFPNRNDEKRRARQVSQIHNMLK